MIFYWNLNPKTIKMCKLTSLRIFWLHSLHQKSRLARRLSLQSSFANAKNIKNDKKKIKKNNNWNYQSKNIFALFGFRSPIGLKTNNQFRVVCWNLFSQTIKLNNMLGFQCVYLARNQPVQQLTHMSHAINFF